MRLLPHRACVIARQQAAAHEEAQQPPAHACLHVGDAVRMEPAGAWKTTPPAAAAASNTPSMTCRTITRPAHRT